MEPRIQTRTSGRGGNNGMHQGPAPTGGAQLRRCTIVHRHTRAKLRAGRQVGGPAYQGDEDEGEHRREDEAVRVHGVLVVHAV